MPHMVQYTVPARHVRKGDYYVENAVRFAVESVEIKTKWTTLFLDNTNKRRVENDTQVTVQRSELTEDEKAERSARLKRESIKRAIDDAPKALAAAKEKLIEELDVYSDFNGAYHAHRYESYVKQQTITALWRRVELTAEKGEMPLTEAYERVRMETMDRFLEHTRWLSRSTSASVNVTEDMKNEAIAEWLRGHRWFG